MKIITNFSDEMNNIGELYSFSGYVCIRSSLLDNVVWTAYSYSPTTEGGKNMPCVIHVWSANNMLEFEEFEHSRYIGAYIDGLVQDCSNIANALELLQSCTKPSIFPDDYFWGD